MQRFNSVSKRFWLKVILIVSMSLITGQAKADQPLPQVSPSSTPVPEQKSTSELLQSKLPVVIPIPRFVTPLPPLYGRRVWFGISSAFSQFYKKYAGYGFSLGYQGEVIGFDVRYLSATLNYGNISVSPDPSVASSLPTDETSQTLVFRSDYDQWTLRQVEPGVSVRAHLFTGFLPTLTEISRLGVASSNFTDTVNGISFSGLLVSFLAGFQLQMSRKSHFAIENDYAYYFGKVSSSQQSGIAGSLPLSYVTSSISLVYWF